MISANVAPNGVTLECDSPILAEALARVQEVVLRLNAFDITRSGSPSRGISSSRLRRLCTRAPRIRMLSAASRSICGGLQFIGHTAGRDDGAANHSLKHHAAARARNRRGRSPGRSRKTAAASPQTRHLNESSHLTRSAATRDTADVVGRAGHATEFRTVMPSIRILWRPAS